MSFYCIKVFPEDKKSTLLQQIGNDIVFVFDEKQDMEMFYDSEPMTGIIKEDGALEIMRQSLKSYYGEDNKNYNNLNTKDEIIRAYENIISENITYVCDEDGTLTIMFD